MGAPRSEIARRAETARSTLRRREQVAREIA